MNMNDSGIRRHAVNLVLEDDSHSPPQTSKTTQVSPPTNTVEPACQEPSDSHPASQYITRLPKLEVSKYSGDPLNWKSFWDCFESAIDLNPYLSVVQKLNYLRTQLETVSSRLGYVLLRPLPVLQSCNIVSSLLSVAVNHDSDEQDLQRFWAVEEAGVMTYSSDKTFLEQYSSTHITRQDDGSYSAMFPWKDDRPPLPDNYTVCQERTQSLVHRLAQMPGMLQTYDNILKEQVSRGFIEQVIPDGNSAAHTTR
ncbi:uncharacterized protein [Dysidea avara]|uniref:uncharacterized protein n=1 Tax=Dysidea avara TaxID=196820 RepID=UPI0033249935